MNLSFISHWTYRREARFDIVVTSNPVIKDNENQTETFEEVALKRNASNEHSFVKNTWVTLCLLAMI